jgi:hypothetical protein
VLSKSETTWLTTAPAGTGALAGAEARCAAIGAASARGAASAAIAVLVVDDVAGLTATVSCPDEAVALMPGVAVSETGWLCGCPVGDTAEAVDLCGDTCLADIAESVPGEAISALRPDPADFTDRADFPDAELAADDELPRAGSAESEAEDPAGVLDDSLPVGDLAGL